MADKRTPLAIHDLSSLRVELPARPAPAVVDLPESVTPIAAETIFHGAQGGGKTLAASKRPPQSVHPTPSNVREMYPSLNKRKREHLIPYSIRLPLSMIERLAELDGEGLVISEIIRDFIAKGLDDIAKSQRADLSTTT